VEDNDDLVTGVLSCAARRAEDGHRHLVSLLDDRGRVLAGAHSDQRRASDAVATSAAELGVGPGNVVVTTRQGPDTTDPFTDARRLRRAVDGLGQDVRLLAWLICDDEGFDVCVPPREAA
jgi:hypothetical protein